MDIYDLVIVILTCCAVSAIVDFLLFKLIVMKLGLQKYLRFASAYATQLGVKSGESKRGRILKIKSKETQSRLLEGLIEELPMGAQIKQVMNKKGISGLDVFDALQDENFIKGVMFLYKTFGGIASKITGKLTGNEPKPEETDMSKGY